MPNSTLKGSACLLALFVCSGFVMALWHGGGGRSNDDGHPLNRHSAAPEPDQLARRLMGHGGHHDDDDLEAKAENAALARRDALLFTATAWIFIPAYLCCS